MATTLNDTQALYVNQLLFEELHDVSEGLVRLATNAADGDDIAGDDALGTYLFAALGLKVDERCLVAVEPVLGPASVYPE